MKTEYSCSKCHMKPGKEEFGGLCALCFNISRQYEYDYGDEGHSKQQNKMEDGDELDIAAPI